MKKFLALVLALVMTMSLVTISAGAEDFTDDASITYEEAVDVMTAIGVVGGYADGSFNPAGTLTRGAAAKIICNMILGPTEAGALATVEAPFSDVPSDHVFAGYIAYCVSEGIVSGYSDGTFRPAGTLTGYAFMKMLLGALGYDAVTEGYTGANYAINVAKRALNIGLANGLTSAFVGGKALTREEACLYALNTLKADMVEYDNASSITIGDIVISNSSKAESVDAVDSATDYRGGTEGSTGTVQFCETFFKDLTLNESVDDYNCEANIWSWKSDEVGTYAIKSAVLATYTTDVADITLGDLYKLAPSTDLVLEVYENGSANGSVTASKGSTTKAFDTTYQGATIYVVDDDADGKADSLAVKYPYLAKVTKVTEATASVDRFITMTVYNDYAKVATTGVTYTTEDFAKDDYVLVYVDGAYATTEAMNAAAISVADVILGVEAAEVVVGKIESVAGTNGSAVTALTVGGEKYKAADANFATLGLTAGSTAVADSSYGFSSEYTLYLSNGYVIGVKGAAAAGSSIENIVYVTKAAYASTNTYGETTFMVETVKFDGTSEIVENYGWYDTDLNGGERVKDGKVYTSATSNSTSISAGFYVREYDSATKSYKFTAPVATTSTALDNATNYYGTNAINGAVSMTATTKAVTIDQVAGSGPVKAYITANTALLFIDGTGSKLTVSVANGAMKQNIADNSAVLLSKDTDGNYVAEVIIIGAKQVEVSASTVYVVGTPTGVNTNGNEYSMYDITTGEKTTITSDNASSVNGYVTYSTNDKGVYTFTAVGAGAATNKDGYYALTSAATKFNTTLTEGNLVDCEAGAAVIVNATGVAANDNLSIDDIAKATALTATALVKDEVVTAIVVTAITKAV